MAMPRSYSSALALVMCGGPRARVGRDDRDWDDVLDDGVEKPKECPCKVTMRIMANLGGKKTAAMHARPTDDWSCEDWEDHFQEEETLLLPILYARGLYAYADRIFHEHTVMRRYYKKHGCMPTQALMEHAALEDYIVSTYLGDLDPFKEAARKKAKVAVKPKRLYAGLR